jgi:hypothetical protein
LRLGLRLPCPVSTEGHEPFELSLLFVLRLPSHPVLDVVVASPEPSRRDACPERIRRDEVQLLLREPVMRRQHPVDFIDDVILERTANKFE